MKFILILISLILALSSSALAQTAPSEDKSSGQIEQLMADSMKDLRSYRYNENMDFNITFTNNSSLSTFYKTTIGNGAVDLKARESNYSESYIQQDSKAYAHGYDTIYINGTVYTLRGGNWTIFKPTAGQDQNLTWSLYDEIRDQTELVMSTGMTLAGIETLGDEESYKLQSTNNQRIFGIFLAAGLESIEVLPTVAAYDINFSEVAKSRSLIRGNLSITAWVSKRTGFLQKTEVAMDFLLTPEVLGASSDEARDMIILVRTVDSAVFYGFNQPVKIVLPSEARDAKPESSPAEGGYYSGLMGSGCSDCGKGS